MSYKKIKIINPDTVRNPETGYIYLGWGDITAASFTGPWIKQADGTVSVISGGTGGGGGGVSYWLLQSSGYVAPVSNNKLRIGGDTTGTQDLNVAGGIKIGNTTTNTSGSIRWTGTDFEGYKGSSWVSLTSSGGTSPSGEGYWAPVSQGIIYDGKNVYIGGYSSMSDDDDVMNVYGGINLKSSTETNNGTIQYSSLGVGGFYGYNNGWKKLNVFEYNNNNGSAFYNGRVVIGNIDTSGLESDYHLLVSGITYSQSYRNDWNYLYPTNGYSLNPSGGFGGWSGSTYKYGLTKSVNVASTESGKYITFDIVNGLIVGISDPK